MDDDFVQLTWKMMPSPLEHGGAGERLSYCCIKWELLRKISLRRVMRAIQIDFTIVPML